MINIRPSADLRNSYKEISALVKKTKEPVYITVNGREDVAIIDVKSLDLLYQTIELLTNVAQGLEDANAGRLHSSKDVKKILEI